MNDLRKQGLGVAAISYDSPAILKNFAERRAIAFPLLSDEGSKIIRAFGILNEQAPAGSPAFGIPHPGTYLVDPGGRVVAKYFEDDYTQRYTASEILVRRFGSAAGASHETIETNQLRIVTSAGMSRVLSGQRIALTVDVELKPKMHVYAPGVEGYIPIDWSMTAGEAAVVHPVENPPSRKLHLPAIGETVPVYAGNFRLVRDITFAKDAKLKPLLGPNGEITVEGTFKYQACDDRMCYLPQTVPLKWHFQLTPHDRERVPATLQKKSGN